MVEEEEEVVVVKGFGWEGWVGGGLVVVVRMWSGCWCGKGCVRRSSGFVT